jgi:homoserine kinase
VLQTVSVLLQTPDHLITEPIQDLRQHLSKVGLECCFHCQWKVPEAGSSSSGAAAAAAGRQQQQQGDQYDHHT